MNKRRSGTFDALDEKTLDYCLKKAAFLLKNADLHDSQLRNQHLQKSLAEKFSALLQARSDRFR